MCYEVEILTYNLESEYWYATFSQIKIKKLESLGHVMKGDKYVLLRNIMQGKRCSSIVLFRAASSKVRIASERRWHLKKKKKNTALQYKMKKKLICYFSNITQIRVYPKPSNENKSDREANKYKGSFIIS